jgi:NAD(P)H-hydrate epimerase
MFLVTAAEMRECDRRTIEEHRVPGPVLMERAGYGIFSAIRRRYEHLNRRRIWIVCGRGNNGGDGLVLARLLHDAGHNPRVLLTDPVERIGGDAVGQVQPVARRRIPLETITESDLSDFGNLTENDILVDAILGTGFSGVLQGEKERIVTAMNGSRAQIVAVDIPSGLVADRGEVGGTAILADLTVTMASPKRSFVFRPAQGYVGDWEVVDIGIPPEVEAQVHPVARLLTRSQVAAWLPRTPRAAHKGTRGRLLIAGGSPGLTGAPCLAASGALAAGIGLVRVAVPASLNPVIEAKLTEPMSFPAPETATGSLAAGGLDFLLGLQDRWDALALGPGLGLDAETGRLVRDLYRRWDGPMIIDADGLTALAAEGLPRPSRKTVPRVLTPHLGEMARLTIRTIPELAADPIQAAREFASRHRVVLLLKGATSVIAEPGGDVLVNTTGNPGLATGGSGDVLSGILGALLARGVEPFRAAACAAYLFGFSADHLAEGVGERGVLPSAVAANLAAAWTAIVEDPNGV